MCSCLGPRCITGGCSLVLLPVPKGTLGPGLGIYEGATVQGQEEGPRHGPERPEGEVEPWSLTWCDPRSPNRTPGDRA